MRFWKLFVPALFAALAVYGQLVPGWHILELAQQAEGKTRGQRAVVTSQAAARASLAGRFGTRARVRAATEVVMNALVVETDATAQELAALPGVARVWPVFEVHPELDRAAALLGVTKAWEAMGGPENAGKGMKIGIIDSGIDLEHPGFRGESMQAPEGYPKVSSESFREKTNGKVIAHRSYDAMLGFEDSVEDRSGHGTGVAMVAAGGRNKSPYGEIQGIAPGAWLGVYRVFSGPTGGASNTAVILRALDDAIADGMDVINMSLGFLPGVREEVDPLRAVVGRASAMGVTIVKSAGNSGPGRGTGSSPHVGAEGLTVGASWNDRIFASGVRVNQAAPVPGVAGTGPAPADPVEAPIKDIAVFDIDGLACLRLPAGSLAGAVAFILRGECFFEQKLNNVKAAGAIGAVVYTHADSPQPIIMNVGDADLPAMMVSNKDGLLLKQLLQDNPESTVSLNFNGTLPFALDPNRLASFSSRGPNVASGISPDLIAIGDDVLTAAQKSFRGGDVYDPSGYTVTGGTSFSSPMVAGAYAALKAARPGLTASQYRSLLVTSAAAFTGGGERPMPVQAAGTGLMRLDAALSAPLTFEPYSLSLGAGERRIDRERSVKVTNAGADPGVFRVRVESSDKLAPVVEPAEFSLAPGDSTTFKLRFTADAEPGEYQGFVAVTRNEEPVVARLAYWYGVPTNRPAAISFLPSPPTTASTGSNVNISTLIVDSSGLAVADAPKVTVLEGTGEVVSTVSQDLLYPGIWQIRVRIAGASGDVNRFRIEAGEMVREVTIRAR
jgi:minor extracellular serine protease Vpr